MHTNKIAIFIQFTLMNLQIASRNLASTRKSPLFCGCPIKLAGITPLFSENYSVSALRSRGGSFL